jgi:hypothetical protein
MAKLSKAPKLAAAGKQRSRTSAPPPPSLAKNGRVKVAPVPAQSAPISTAPGDDKSARGGLSKNELKAQFAKLSTATAQISGLKRALNKSFYDIGTLLNQIRDERLFEVKGYGSLESFVEREIDINKAICLKAARIAETIHREHALAAGLERAAAAVAALDGETEPSPLLRPGGSPAGGVPLHKQ